MTIRQSLHGQRGQRKTAIFEKVHQATATHWLRKPRLVAGKIGQVAMVGQGVIRSFFEQDLSYGRVSCPTAINRFYAQFCPIPWALMPPFNAEKRSMSWIFLRSPGGISLAVYTG
jgi:hypothetical protein